MESQQRIQELTAELNQLQQQGETISQQIEQLNVSLTDINNARDAVKAIKGSVGKETLVPIGAGCFVKTELKSEDVIVGVGSDVAITRSIDETTETLSKDKEEVEKLINQLTETLQTITDQIAQKRPEAEKLMKENGVQP
ncbi:MAG: prefoldin subunit alpha [Methanosphaera sp.]|nr:prefoldin subunit alpha [Methanosphaera sp.]